MSNATEADRDPRLDRPRMLAISCGTLVIVLPLMLLLMKHPAPVPDPASAAAATTTFEQDIALAASLIAGGQAQASLAPLERAQKARPNAFAVHNSQCVAYGMLHRRDEAVAACERALAVEPNSQLGKNNLAWVASISPNTDP